MLTDLIVKMLKSGTATSTVTATQNPKNLLLMSDDNDSYIKLVRFRRTRPTLRSLSLVQHTLFCSTRKYSCGRLPSGRHVERWLHNLPFALRYLPFMGQVRRNSFGKLPAPLTLTMKSGCRYLRDARRSCSARNEPDERITADDAVCGTNGSRHRRSSQL
jgi:hypothetical protein